MAILVYLVILGCGGQDEPKVPTSSRSNPSSGIVFPVSADGTIDESTLAKMSFKETSYDFGFVDAGAVITKRFTFENTGAQPLTITNGRSTCGCTVPEYPEEPILPGDTSSVKVVFNTTGKTGVQNKPVTLTANTYPNETVIRMVGTVDNHNNSN